MSSRRLSIDSDWDITQSSNTEMISIQTSTPPPAASKTSILSATKSVAASAATGLFTIVCKTAVVLRTITVPRATVCKHYR